MADCQALIEAVLSREHGQAEAPGLRAHLESCSTCGTSVRQIGLVDGALAALAVENSVPPPFERIARRARAAARSRRRARLLRRTLPMSLVFAAAVVATIGVTRLVHRSDGGKVAAATGDVLDASHGTVQAILADGARLTLASGRVAVEASERLRSVVRLEGGSVFLDVPHRDAGATFALLTDEVEVRVRGTRFDVARLAEGTRVNVTQGVVEVRPRRHGQRPFLLKKGETSLLEGSARVRERARADALASLEQRDDTRVGEKILAWLGTDPPAQEAAEAHALLGWKLSRDGDRVGALENYRLALSLLPASTEALWADNACAQLALLLERDHPEEGAAAWRRYLERFPAGVHAAMARSRLAPGGTRR